MKTVDFRTKEQKKMDFKEKVSVKAEQTENWIVTHPNLTRAIVLGVTVAVPTVIKVGKGIANAYHNQVMKTTMYCNDIQSNVRIKHELRYDEIMELRYRMDQGQTKLQALTEMNLIRK